MVHTRRTLPKKSELAPPILSKLQEKDSQGRGCTYTMRTGGGRCTLFAKGYAHGVVMDEMAYLRKGCLALSSVRPYFFHDHARTPEWLKGVVWMM